MNDEVALYCVGPLQQYDLHDVESAYEFALESTRSMAPVGHELDLGRRKTF